jgi:formylmethanofuran dehydrogenase subunit E
MGTLAGQILELQLPQNDKRLLTVAETDGCFVDGVSAATGCTVGPRTLRVYDYGKVAAVFIDGYTGDAVRITPRDGLRDEACQYLPEAQSRWHAQLQRYQTMPDAVMFAFQPVTLRFDVKE